METTEKKLDYRPRGDRVIVKRLPKPEQAAGEMFIPDSQRKPLNEGIAVLVGPGLRNRHTGEIEPVDIEAGQHVCFLEFSGETVEIDGEEYLSMREVEIHGVRG